MFGSIICMIFLNPVHPSRAADSMISVETPVWLTDKKQYGQTASQHPRKDNTEFYQIRITQARSEALRRKTARSDLPRHNPDARSISR